MDGYTIYANPSDAPGYWVIRHWVTEALIDGEVVHTFDTQAVGTPITADGKGLEVLRETMRQEGRICFPRQANDDPVIVESWI